MSNCSGICDTCRACFDPEILEAKAKEIDVATERMRKENLRDNGNYWFKNDKKQKYKRK